VRRCRDLAGVVDDLDMAEVEAWAAGLEEVHARIAARFARSEPRERVLAYVPGLLRWSGRTPGRWPSGPGRRPESVFRQVLDKYFEGSPDQRTIAQSRGS
jgi:hypothetical protein